MAASECIHFMSGKGVQIDKGMGEEVGFVRPIWK